MERNDLGGFGAGGLRGGWEGEEWPCFCVGLGEE